MKNPVIESQMEELPARTTQLESAMREADSILADRIQRTQESSADSETVEELAKEVAELRAQFDRIHQALLRN